VKIAETCVKYPGHGDDAYRFSGLNALVCFLTVAFFFFAVDLFPKADRHRQRNVAIAGATPEEAVVTGPSF